jgi:hypothetical protein
MGLAAVRWHARLSRMQGDPEEARRGPRTSDYVMWAVVGLTMVVVLRAVFAVDNALAQVLGLGYVALGGLLLWRRMQSLSR